MFWKNSVSLLPFPCTSSAILQAKGALPDGQAENEENQDEQEQEEENERGNEEREVEKEDEEKEQDVEAGDEPTGALDIFNVSLNLYSVRR